MLLWLIFLDDNGSRGNVCIDAWNAHGDESQQQDHQNVELTCLLLYV